MKLPNQTPSFGLLGVVVGFGLLALAANGPVIYRLRDLQDVKLPASPTDAHVLTYVASGGYWTNKAGAGGSGLTNTFDSNFSLTGGTNVHLSTTLVLTNVTFTNGVTIKAPVTNLLATPATPMEYDLAGRQTNAATAVPAGTYGDASHIPQFQFDASGIPTNVTSVSAAVTMGAGFWAQAPSIVSSTYSTTTSTTATQGSGGGIPVITNSSTAISTNNTYRIMFQCDVSSASKTAVLGMLYIDGVYSGQCHYMPQIQQTLATTGDGILVFYLPISNLSSHAYSLQVGPVSSVSISISAVSGGSAIGLITSEIEELTTTPVIAGVTNATLYGTTVIPTVQANTVYITNALIQPYTNLTVSSQATNYLPNLAASCMFRILATNNVYLGQPMGFPAGNGGQTIVIQIQQDGTGSRMINFATNYWKFSSNSIPTFSTAANAVDLLTAVVDYDGTNMFVTGTTRLR